MGRGFYCSTLPVVAAMVSKTLKRQRRKTVQSGQKASTLLSQIGANVGTTAGAKVRISHRLKHKRKYRIGGASPVDMYAEWEAFEGSEHAFSCPTCGATGYVKDFCAKCRGPRSTGNPTPAPQDSTLPAVTAASSALAAFTAPQEGGKKESASTASIVEAAARRSRR